MTDYQAVALGRFCGLAEFCKQYPQYKFDSDYYINILIEILDQYEKAKHENNFTSISSRTETIFSGAKKQTESALQK